MNNKPPSLTELASDTGDIVQIGKTVWQSDGVRLAFIPLQTEADSGASTVLPPGCAQSREMAQLTAETFVKTGIRAKGPFGETHFDYPAEHFVPEKKPRLAFLARPLRMLGITMKKEE